MKAQRRVKFKVCYVDVADVEKTLFDSADYQMVEDFAINYVGEQKEIYIKKVFERTHLQMVTDRPGSEL